MNNQLINKLLLSWGTLDYCILHGWQSLPEHLPSDLDIVVAPEDLPKLEQTLLDTKEGRMVNLIQHESTCYYFVLAIHEGDKVWFVPVDATTDYRRNGRIWFSSNELLKNKLGWKGFWVASPEVEFKYMLVKKILKQGLPPHAGERLRELALSLGATADAARKTLLGLRWGPKVTRWIREENWETLEAHLPLLKRVLKRERLRKDPLNAFRYWLPELGRILQRWRYPTGLWVAVLGPDGAGKSTVIDRLREDVRGAFRRRAIFHLMLGLLRKRGDGGPVTDPHGKPPRSFVDSLLKLGYYFMDYNAGYWLRIRPALVRSTLVLFDRYYHDLLVDPARYRYGAPLWLARIVGRLIPKPDLWLILDVSEEEILRRKQEVPLEEIRRQREGYRHLASELPNAYLLDGNLPPEEVTQQARDVVLDFLHERYVTRRPVWFPHARQRDDLGWLKEALGASRGSEDKKARYTHLRLPDGRGYLFPRNSRRAAVAGLSLYPAQKPRGKIVKSLLSLGLRSGLASLVLPKAAVDLEPLRDFIAEVFKRKDLFLCVSLGTPGPHRKPVIQVVTEGGEIMGFVKVGWNEATRKLVHNEAETLRRLGTYDLPFLIPRVLFAGEWQGKTLCIQSPPPQGARAAPPEMGPGYVKALQALAGTGVRRYRLEDSPLWKQLEERRKQIASRYWSALLDKGMAAARECWRGKEVPFHPAHGDFTPWNAFQNGEALYLFDWEYAREEAPAGYDLFHFLVQTAWLVDVLTPSRITETLLKETQQPQVEEYWKCVCLQGMDVPELLHLFILVQLTFFGIIEPRADDKASVLVPLLWHVGALSTGQKGGAI